METKKILTDLVYAIMVSEDTFGMEVVQSAVEGAMQQLNLSFIGYDELLESFEEDYVYEVTPFDETDEYFFDKINTSNISKNQIDVLVNRCVA